MTNTKLEKTFNLPSIDLFEEEKPQETTELDQFELKEPTLDVYATIDKIDRALPMVSGLDNSDKELDELADYALNASKELLQLSQNVDQKYIGEIAAVSGNMLAHAITAKTNKAKKKLDMISLQIKKQLADQKKDSGKDDDKDSEGVKVLDRNDILKALANGGNLDAK